MFPDIPGLHQSDGHLVPQATHQRQPLHVVEALRVPISIGGRTIFRSKASCFSPPPPPSGESKPIVHGHPYKSRVLLGTSWHKGRPPSVLASTKNSHQTGKPENHGVAASWQICVIFLTMGILARD